MFVCPCNPALSMKEHKIYLNEYMNPILDTNSFLSLHCLAECVTLMVFPLPGFGGFAVKNLSSLAASLPPQQANRTGKAMFDSHFAQ